MMKTGNPNLIINQLIQTNPQAKEFFNSNKTINQIASEHGINLDDLRALMR